MKCENPLLIADCLHLDTDSNVHILFLRCVRYKDTIRCNAHGERALNDAMHMIMLPFHFRNLTCMAKIKTWELICRNQDQVAFFQKVGMVLKLST